MPVFSRRFEANFGSQTVTFTFKCTGLPEVQPGQIRVLRKGNKMEVLVWQRAQHIFNTSLLITAIRRIYKKSTISFLHFVFRIYWLLPVLIVRETLFDNLHITQQCLVQNGTYKRKLFKHKRSFQSKSLLTIFFINRSVLNKEFLQAL